MSAVHLKHLYPFQADLPELMKSFDHVVVVELNTGQLCQLLRAQFLIDAKSISKVQGKPFGVAELTERLAPYLEN